jgi:hypothetical protein
MSIKPPHWCEDATPTLNGWVSPSGEMLKKQRMLPEHIEEFYRERYTQEPIAQPQVLTEAPGPKQRLLSADTIKHFWGKISGEN